MSKTDRVLHHLQKYGRITSMDAIERYHATRLSAIIFNLRKKRHLDIETEYAFSTDDEGRTIRYGIYRLKE